MCYNGKPHDMVDIYRFDMGWNEEYVVQWCRKCGAVCIRQQSDGRNFGYIVGPYFPENLCEYIDMKKELKNGSND